MKTQEVNEKMEVIENKEENEETENSMRTEEKRDGANYSINLALIGGVAGAGIGLLANPETSKKVLKNLGESEFVKLAAQEFRKTAQELLTDQAQTSIRQLASGYISKIDEGLLTPKKELDDNSGEPSRIEEIKEENKNLNERLQKIEKMLNDLVDSK
ncbi:YtxH domain-containing protein [Domibacillus epiphyticus]|uniref:Gas vesicle protein GvpP n=1 Tax=Domibacillus epiphyticus TaxID=1714355 RepID=A0A1V2A4I9_9BACI|nr:YtxH domain-containing protein [Domibacillus epiphyticus]OMP65931.1 hypothetical protein BTO28_15375 [Domibacillus epiphyticus]